MGNHTKGLYFEDFLGKKRILAFVFIQLTFHSELLLFKAASSLSLSPRPLNWAQFLGKPPFQPATPHIHRWPLSSFDPQPDSFTTLSFTLLYSSSRPCTRWRRPWNNPLSRLITNVRMQSSNPCSLTEGRAAGWLAYPDVVGDEWRGRGNDNETR